MDDEALAQRRIQYETEGFSVAQAAADPLDQFGEWYDAVADHLDQPNAMVVATADADGRPSARSVLLKGAGPRGLVFYTNADSSKGRAIADNPRAAHLLHLAARINISEWQNNKQSKQYISFIKGKNGKKVSDYFRDFIGCQEGVDGPGDVVHGVGKNGPRPVAEPDRGRFIPGLAFDTNPLGRILYISASVAGRSVKANVAIALAPESGCRWRGGGGTPGGGVGDPDVAPSGIGFVIVQQQLGVEVSGDTHRWFRFADGRSRAKPYNVAAVTVGNG